MATPASEITKDILETVEGAASVIADSSIDKVPSLPPEQPSKGIFFRFGQILATTAETLICCACNKAQQKVDAQVEANPSPSQVQSAPKP